MTAHFRNFAFIMAVLGAAVFARDASAESWGSYLSSYRLAIELKGSSTSSDLNYELPRSALLPKDCKVKGNEQSKMQCRMSLTQTRDVTWGLSLQQAFKRTGWWYSSVDVGFSFFTLDAKVTPPDATILVPQPLEKARVHLYGSNVRGYYEFGITPPRIIPDILLSVGLGAHYSKGNVKINDLRQNVDVLSNTFYFQFEIVWWRFQDGSLSSYAAIETNQSDQKIRGNFGEYAHVSLTPSSNSIGLIKFVLPFKTGR